jgi:TonB family protein
MSKLLFLSTSGPRTIPVFASVVAHAAIAVAAAAGHGGGGAVVDHSLSGLLEIQVEPLEAPIPAVADAHDAIHHDELEPHHHTHSYPVSADHDAHPHSHLIDHRLEHHSAGLPATAAAAGGEMAAAPSVLNAGPAAASMPTFSMVIGNGGAVSGITGAGGQSDGVGTGTATGTGPGPQAPGPQAPGAEATLADATVSEHAHLVSTLQPEYPPDARALGLEARVALEIVVDRSGRVADAHVVRGASHGFDESALGAIKRARFSPARRGEDPVRVRMAWTVDFRLE